MKFYNDLEKIKYFINNGLSTKIIEYHLTMCAPKNIDINIYKYLIKFYNIDNKIILQSMRNRPNKNIDYLNIIEFMIDEGINLFNDYNLMFLILIRAIENNNLKIVKYIIENGHEVFVYLNELIDLAIKNNYTEIENYIKNQQDLETFENYKNTFIIIKETEIEIFEEK